MTKIVSLSEAASIAMHAMVLIAKAEGMINVAQIAEATDSSKHHVAKVMQRLVKDGFIVSHRGPTGGFSLKKKPADISMLDIYEAIEGKVEISQCPLDKQICPFDKCIMNNVTNQMAEDFKNFLSGNTLDRYLV